MTSASVRANNPGYSASFKKIVADMMWQDAGFLTGKPDVTAAMKTLAYYINLAPDKYKAFSEQELLSFPAPGKWSRKQVLGHLVDSAVNNLKRFTDIQTAPQPYTVQPYPQNELVEINHYQELPLDQLLQLWVSLNRQIVFVTDHTPEERLYYPVDPRYNNNQMQTLGWIICDYVAHMEHHWKQVW